MWRFVQRFVPNLGWMVPGTSPIDSILQGLIAACAISILDHLLRIHLHIQCLNDPARVGVARLQLPGRAVHSLRLFILTSLFSSLGARVASLVVLEFSLRTISSLLSRNHRRSDKQIFLQGQFSLGCGMVASLSFLMEGAPHSTVSLALSAALAGTIAAYVRRLATHVGLMYELHSSERYCGLCILLLTTWRNIPTLLSNALKLVFIVADLAAIFLINKDFISTSEAVRFWTPLTICYTLLVIYMQEEQRQNPSEQSAYQTVVVRMGGLLILTLTVGRWADVVHVLLSLLGETWCLVQAGPMLEVCRQQDSISSRYVEGIRGSRADASRRYKGPDIPTSDQ
ncbi:transmembrane protein 82 [Leucoraja erinacea]|uniref:transmembrane protein 82 n=1 Tax=Leucoraja erinaceus TaxID=7782 RepID=UPI002453C128|nr:transmembrane protein 82 [Leucoraja erinacea]